MQSRNKEPDILYESVMKEVCLIVQLADAEDSRKPDYSDKISVYTIESLAKTA